MVASKSQRFESSCLHGMYSSMQGVNLHCKQESLDDIISFFSPPYVLRVNCDNVVTLISAVVVTLLLILLYLHTYMHAITNQKLSSIYSLTALRII